jgi:hypothetical protein
VIAGKQASSGTFSGVGIRFWPSSVDHADRVIDPGRIRSPFAPCFLGSGVMEVSTRPLLR